MEQKENLSPSLTASTRPLLPHRPPRLNAEAPLLAQDSARGRRVEPEACGQRFSLRGFHSRCPDRLPQPLKPERAEGEWVLRPIGTCVCLSGYLSVWPGSSGPSEPVSVCLSVRLSVRLAEGVLSGTSRGAEIPPKAPVARKDPAERSLGKEGSPAGRPHGRASLGFVLGMKGVSTSVGSQGAGS